MTGAKPPLKVLHVVYYLEGGGVSHWIRNLMRQTDPTEIRMDVARHIDAGSAFGAELEKLGARIFTLPSPRHPLAHARSFLRILREHGPYDVVHSHMHGSGLIMALARLGGVPVRVAMCHNPVRERRPGPVESLYHKFLDVCLLRYFHSGLAVSEPAARFMFGDDWRNDRRVRILPCAIDSKPFGVPVVRAEVRAELGIPADAFVIGQVGLFSKNKNHQFTVKIARAMRADQKNVWLLLVGDGHMREVVREQARAAGIERHVVFAGVRNDVPRLMLGAMDLLLHPSLHEGLGLVVIEAQAATLPVVASTAVPQDAQVVPGLLTRLPLEFPPDRWISEITKAQSAKRPSAAEIQTLFENSRFDIRRQAEEIHRLYRVE